MISCAALIMDSAVPAGRLFALDEQTLISTAILLFNFCILAVILGAILYKPVQKYLRGRTERICKELEEAEKRMAQAEALKAEYEAKLTEIAAERAAALEAARIEAAERGRQVMEEARHEAEVIRRRAEESLAAEREKLKREAWQYITEISVMIAEKLVKRAIDSEVQDQLFKEALAELEEASWPS